MTTSLNLEAVGVVTFISFVFTFSCYMLKRELCGKKIEYDTIDV
jgi:hypothetical protein